MIGRIRHLKPAVACLLAGATAGAAAALDVGVPEHWKMPLWAACVVFAAAGMAFTLTWQRWGRIRRPAMLPQRLMKFRGRAEELDWLHQRHREQSGVSQGNPKMLLIHGGPGVGKSELANELAHQLRDQYPDGQLYSNLGRAADPREPQVILKTFVVKLGESEEKAAQLTLKALQDLFLAMTARRRILIVLDAARDADQVKALLPNSGQCAVVVTSRSNLGPQLAHRPLHLMPPTAADAIEILRAYAEPDNPEDAGCAAEVVELCERLPRALRASGDAARTDIGLRRVCEQLRRPEDRLERLKNYHRDVTEGYSMELSRLDEPVQQAFMLLSMVKTTTFVPWVLQPLFGAIGREVTTDEAGNIIAALSVAGLLLPVEGPDSARYRFPRYRFSPLARLLADQLRLAAIRPGGLLATTTQDDVRDCFLRTVLAMSCEVMDGGQGPPVPRPEVPPAWVPRRDAWLEIVRDDQEHWRRAEHENLLSAAVFARTRYPEASRQLLIRLGGVMGIPVNLDDFAGHVEQAVAAALPDETLELRLALMHHAVAVEDHIRMLAEHEALTKQPAPPRISAEALLLKGRSLQEIGRYNEAGEALRDALRAVQSTSAMMLERAVRATLTENDATLDPESWRDDGPTEGEPVRKGHDTYLSALISLLNGRIAARRNDLTGMTQSLERAGRFVVGDLAWEARLACERVRLRLDHGGEGPSPESAMADVCQARLAFEAMGNVPGQARARLLLARLLMERGNLPGSAQEIDRARSLLRTRDEGLPLSAALQRAAADLSMRMSRPDEARRGYELALLQYTTAGDFWYGACVRVGLAEAERALGQPATGEAHLWQAAALFSACGDRQWLRQTRERLCVLGAEEEDRRTQR
ncbi:ATP-binding protein [Nonomuraea sp. FMUSA5-5]|uniref:ATP-binding protein n=1 Tax=Nonomuraea composti TaxID=2720023 RepID=A0ABX1B7U7_9ACTN|nr:NB-ARC domain-containing protein [Nonomuraea sp. FMUSA5-5]NJP93908.1 ATP-binding protein [Nonomuraea sp. FMUSA5-5]